MYLSGSRDDPFWCLPIMSVPKDEIRSCQAFCLITFEEQAHFGLSRPLFFSNPKRITKLFLVHILDIEAFKLGASRGCRVTGSKKHDFLSFPMQKVGLFLGTFNFDPLKLAILQLLVAIP